MAPRIRTDYVGQRFETTNYGWLVVIEYTHNTQVKVRFEATGFETIVRMDQIKAGRVKDFLVPTICNRGYIGIGPYETSKGGVTNQLYRIWRTMLVRCYDENQRHHWPTYADVHVCREWWCFQTFAAWYVNQPHAFETGYELDKDTRRPGGKFYAPSRCKLIPGAENRRDGNIRSTGKR